MPERAPRDKLDSTLGPTLILSLTVSPSSSKKAWLIGGGGVSTVTLFCSVVKLTH